jgi:hypothetical protein
MSLSSTNLIVSDLDFASEWNDTICGIGTKASLKEWLSDDEDFDLNIMDIDKQICSNFFADSIFDDEPPQAQLDSVDFDLESDDNFMHPGSPVSSQHFPFTNNTYREAFKNLAESIKRSQETRASLKLVKRSRESLKLKSRGKRAGYATLGRAKK